MGLIPSRAQWEGWSLPSKLTAIGAYLSIVSVALTVFFVALSALTEKQAAELAEKAPGVPLTRDQAPSRSAPPPALQHRPAPPNHRGNTTEATDLDDLIADLNSEDLTSLQRTQFMERLAGRRVRWRVKVREVSRLDIGEHGKVMLIFAPPRQQDDQLEDLLSATFPLEQESVLSSLRRGDLAVIEGSLEFTQVALSRWMPELRSGELISFSPSRD